MANSNLHTLIDKILSTGTTPNTPLDDVRRIRLVNAGTISAMILVPFLFFYNWYIGNAQEFIPLVFLFSFVVVSLLLNRNHKNQYASAILITSTIITSYWVVYISPTQVGAPYFNILFGLLSIYIIKNKLLKYGLTLIGFFSFVLLNAYQLDTKPFTLTEYLPVLLMLIGLFIVLTRYDSDYRRKERIIKEQADNLLKLKEEKYEKELQLKQKDVDTVVANNRMQLKIRENFLSALEEIKEEKGSLKAIRSIKLDLKSQIETQLKMGFTEKHLEEINAQFFEKLISKHPKLSKKERELCSYIRLGLSTKEIAALISTSENTIYVTKNRLRAKLNLEANAQLDTYILNF